MEKVEQKNKSTPGQRHLIEVYESVRDLLPDYGRQTWEPFVRMGRRAHLRNESENIM